MILFFEKILYFLGHLYIPLSRFVSHQLSYSGCFWVRHSVYEGQALLGLSDIDFTYVGDKELEVVRDYKNLKKIIPVLGEVNFYKKSYFKYLESCHNEFELRRDPHLLEKLKLKDTFNVRTNALVFLLRTAFSDRKNLKKWPRLRKRKWDQHFYTVATYCDLVIKKNIETYISELSGGEIIFTDDIFKEPSLFPHLWMQTQNQKCDFYDLGKLVLTKSKLIQDVFIAQLSFEFCGVLSQIPLITDKKNVERHFNHILVMISLFESSRAKTLSYSISSFLEKEFQH